ncbi:alpha/beta hydrolase [Robiginitalea sp. SC105]|uniref:alpha/beta hydrolase n=1 Tax=Robiginitalea sp. SC105 TaxID=2762332 RepID=UPI00163A128F|nr:alpha/beta hydrolase [Robiginitalea sp. SC105]MBC2839888.1 alpha/beta hydrolase [Robiginitalea sp. SC105]
MKIFFFPVLALLFAFQAHAQVIHLKKGLINENLPLSDSIGRDLSFYLPKDFDPGRKWPVLFVCDFTGDATRALRFFLGAAEANGYIVATTTSLVDSTQLTGGVLKFAKSLDFLGTILPLDMDRLYAAGIGDGGQFAGLMPNMVKAISGVLSVATGPPNMDLVSSRAPYHYVALLSRSNFYYQNMRWARELFNNKKLVNHIFYYNGNGGLPDETLLDLSIATLTIQAMKSAKIPRDTLLIERTRKAFLDHSDLLWRRGEVLEAYNELELAIDLLGGLTDMEQLEEARRDLRRSATYRAHKREAAKFELKEDILREDYSYYLEDDVLTFNLENLGWWKFQMETIEGFKKSQNPEEKLMGLRLEGYLEALADDYILTARSSDKPDEDALVFLHMLKTIIKPEAPENYLTVISLASKYSDFGTALFYLEELLKTGYSDKDRLYSLEHTALLRIGPEFNALVEKYLDSARYEIPE